MKRQPIYPSEGHIFQHKVKTDDFARILYLGQGVRIDDYKEITEEEYEKLTAEIEGCLDNARN